MFHKIEMSPTNEKTRPVPQDQTVRDLSRKTRRSLFAVYGLSQEWCVQTCGSEFNFNMNAWDTFDVDCTHIFSIFGVDAACSHAQRAGDVNITQAKHIRSSRPHLVHQLHLLGISHSSLIYQLHLLRAILTPFLQPTIQNLYITIICSIIGTVAGSIIDFIFVPIDSTVICPLCITISGIILGAFVVAVVSTILRFVFVIFVGSIFSSVVGTVVSIVRCILCIVPTSTIV
tara:strand:- start:133 stop:822 length:690 start_codon:yes stop_codon:yes gene_type:complete